MQSRSTNSMIISGPTAALFLALFVPLSLWLCNVNNITDLKLFYQSYWTGIPFALHYHLFGTEERMQIRPCSDLLDKRLLSSEKLPTLFKGCFNASITGQYFAFHNKTQNIFPKCQSDSIVQNYTIQDSQGQGRVVEEKIPCGDLTLRDKIETYHLRNSEEANAPFFETHPIALSAAETEFLEEDLAERGFVPAGFTLQSVATTRVINYIFGSGTTAVNYYHSHADRFLSFAVADRTKVWEFLHPIHLDKFEWKHTGAAAIMIRELDNNIQDYVVEMKQEPGDIVMLPSWWIHRTKFNTGGSQDAAPKVSARGVNMAIHYTTFHHVAGLFAYIFMDVLELKDAFYNNGKVQALYEAGQQS